MKWLFLGKWWHWGILLLTAALMWLAGLNKMHVIHFNFFVVLLLVGTFVGLVCIVRFTRPGEQVTRDHIVDDEPSD